MITHPTVLKYDVDAERLVDLYLLRKAEIEDRPSVRRRWSIPFPALRLPRPAFLSRRRSGVTVIPPATTVPHRS